MLTQLSIKNYALIDDLNVSFADGFTTITGETGAGKSILLGGLSMVLGKRADLSTLRNKDSKCIIEAEFDVQNYGLEKFFKSYELEFALQTIIRREIHPSGKSRAFINDSPVTLDVLSELGKRLVDVHSQHQTLQLTEHDFQLHVVDALAGNGSLLKAYGECLNSFRTLEKELETLGLQQQTAIKDQDYNTFLYNELEEAQLEAGMQEHLEEQYEQLSNVETILEQLSSGNQLLHNEEMGLIPMLFQLKQNIAKLTHFGQQYQAIFDRLDSALIDLDDIGTEIQQLHEGVEANPKLLEETNQKLQKLYDLQKKHGVMEASELIRIKDELSEKLYQSENLDVEIEAKEKQLAETEEELIQLAKRLSDQRTDVIPEFKNKLEKMLKDLGMPHASFEIRIIPKQPFKTNGSDSLVFLFAANRGSDYGNLKKVASGGEMSRIMLVIKSILASYEHLPTLIFDEIDSGVSGEISNRMADIMLSMSQHMQVFSITHLPQVASKGAQHFKVYKEDQDSRTYTRIKLLSEEDRVVELAEMLGGKSLSDSALAHAKQLLN